MPEEGQEQEQEKAEEKNTTLGTRVLLFIGAWFLYSLFSGSDDHTLTSFINARARRNQTTKVLVWAAH